MKQKKHLSFTPSFFYYLNQKLLKKISFMVKTLFISSFFLFIFIAGNAQLTITAANTTIQTGATLTVKGDLSSTKDLPEMGKILLQGNDEQTLNMNGKSIPNLEVNNSSNILLTADARISNTLLFTSGKIIIGTYNLTLTSITSISGMGTAKFIETNGSGQVFNEISSNVSSKEIPVGAGTVYHPLFITTAGSYATAKVGVRVSGTSSTTKPPMASDFINANWTITQTGITGTLNVSARYDASDISGNENNLKAYLFDGTDWSSSIGNINTSANTISFPITIASANLTAIDKFDLLKAKVLLQAAYNSSTGLMTDNLRTLNLIPLSDPYRTSEYSSAFDEVNDPTAETIDPSVLSNQSSSNDNIVDWIFLELRNNSTGNNIVETRSALIQRDGDIVDVDGVSPVTFNNVATGNYTIAVRHRNHLGISTDPATFTPSLDEKKSTLGLIDFTTSTNIYGGSATHGVSNGKNVLWGGNSNLDGTVKYAGPGNDKDYILSIVLGGAGTSQVTGYNKADINMDGIVNYSSPNNDKDFLLSKILSGIATNFLNQYLP